MKNTPTSHLPEPSSPRPASSRWAPEQAIEHSTWLRTFARALVRDPNDAEDLVQGALGAAVAAGEEIRDVRGFLTGTVRNLASRLTRDRRHRQDREWSQAAEKPTVAPPADQLLEAMDTMRVVLEEAGKLPAAQGRCIAFRYVEDLEVAAIAERLGTTPSTVRSHLARGLATLRDRLDDRYGDRAAWSALLGPTVLSGSVPAASPLVPGAAAPGTSTAATGFSAAAFLISAMNLKLLLSVTVPALAVWGALHWNSDTTSITRAGLPAEAPLDQADLASLNTTPPVDPGLRPSNGAAPDREELVPAGVSAATEAPAAAASLTADITFKDRNSTVPLFDYAVEVTPLDANRSPILAGQDGILIVATDSKGHLHLEDLPAGTSALALKSQLLDDVQWPIDLQPERVLLDDPRVVLVGVGPTYRFDPEGDTVRPYDELIASASGPGIMKQFPIPCEISWSNSAEPPFLFARFGTTLGSSDDTGPWTIHVRSKEGHMHASAEVSFGRGSSEKLIPLRFASRGQIRFVTETGAPGKALQMPFLTVTHRSSGEASHVLMESTELGGETQLGSLLPGTYAWSAPGQFDAAGLSIGGECEVAPGATVDVVVPALGGPNLESYAILDASAAPDADLSAARGGIADLGLLETVRRLIPERAPDLGIGMWRIPIGPVPLDGWVMSLGAVDGFQISPKTAVLRRSEGSPTFIATPALAPITVKIVPVDASTGTPIPSDFDPEALWLKEHEAVDVGNRSNGGLKEIAVPSNTTAHFVCRADGYKMTEAFFEPGNGGNELRIELERGWSNQVLVFDMGTMGPYAGAAVVADGVELGRTDVEGRLQLELERPPKRIELRLDDANFEVKLSPFRDELLWDEDPLAGYRFVVAERTK